MAKWRILHLCTVCFVCMAMSPSHPSSSTVWARLHLQGANPSYHHTCSMLEACIWSWALNMSRCVCSFRRGKLKLTYRFQWRREGPYLHWIPQPNKRFWLVTDQRKGWHWSWSFIYKFISLRKYALKLEHFVFACLHLFSCAICVLHHMHG